MKHLNLILCIVGLCLIGLSFYITQRVEQETSSAYATSNAISNNPLTDMGGPVAKGTTSGTSSMMNNAIAGEATPYQRMASLLFILGIISLITGLIRIAIPYLRKFFK